VVGAAWAREVDEEGRHGHVRLCDGISWDSQKWNWELLKSGLTGKNERECDAGSCNALYDGVVRHLESVFWDRCGIGAQMLWSMEGGMNERVHISDDHLQ